MKKFMQAVCDNFKYALSSDIISQCLCVWVIFMYFILIGSADGYDNNGNLLEGNHCPVGIPISVIISCLVGIFFRGQQIKNKNS